MIALTACIPPSETGVAARHDHHPCTSLCTIAQCARRLTSEGHANRQRWHMNGCPTLVAGGVSSMTLLCHAACTRLRCCGLWCAAGRVVHMSRPTPGARGTLKGRGLYGQFGSSLALGGSNCAQHRGSGSASPPPSRSSPSAASNSLLSLADRVTFAMRGGRLRSLLPPLMDWSLLLITALVKVQRLSGGGGWPS